MSKICDWQKSLLWPFLAVFCQLPNGRLNLRHKGKGQLISKCLFGVFNSPNKRTKTIRLVIQSNFFVRYLGELKIPKRHFKINWPLVEEKRLEINLERLLSVANVGKVFIFNHFFFTFFGFLMFEQNIQNSMSPIGSIWQQAQVTQGFLWGSSFSFNFG